MFFSEEILGMLIPKESGVTQYTHRTSDLETVESILENGFQFVDSFQKTTDIVIDDPVYLKYWYGIRKGYGTYCIVISISDNILKKYQQLLNNIPNNVSEVLQILSEKIEKDKEVIYVMPTAYVKGYFNTDLNEIKHNPNYDPTFISDQAQENLDNLEKAK